MLGCYLHIKVTQCHVLVKKANVFVCTIDLIISFTWVNDLIFVDTPDSSKRAQRHHNVMLYSDDVLEWATP